MIHQTRTLTALTDISRHISSSLDYKAIAYRCLSSLKENLELERCALFTPDQKREFLSIQVGIDWEEDEVWKLRLSVAQTIAGRVFSSGIPIALQDLREVVDFQPALRFPGIQVVGYIAVPVSVNDQPIGVLTAYRTSTVTMLDEDVSVMKIVASILSQTLKLAEKVEFQSADLRRENAELHTALEGRYRLEKLVSHSPIMENTLSMVSRVAETSASVLLRGESGTGKTLIAKSIHFTSPRNKGPFVVVNCASIPANLIESELFGHERGSFTGAIARRIGKFEAAEGGSLLLDEVGEMPLETQAKLLRVLQDGCYERVGSNDTITADVRLIFATNADLEKRVREKTFREDLYYRLMVIPVNIPALRAHREDILPLASHFLQTLNTKYHKRVSLSPEALAFLEQYAWPGNVRELEHAIERAVILARRDTLAPEDIPLISNPASLAGDSLSPALPVQAAVPTAAERKLYERVPLRAPQVRVALDEAAGIQTIAARKLGVSLRQLRYAAKKFGLDAKEFH